MDLEEIANHVRDTNYFHFPWGHVELPKVLGLQLSKFMVLELLAAALMILIFTSLRSGSRRAGAPEGLFWNSFEVLLLFIRDEVVRPSIGKHDADKFLPFLWNQFFFILFCNLLGILPWSGSPTGSLSVTVALAVVTFFVVLGTGVAKFGPVGYWKSLIPHMELPGSLGVLLIPMIFVIEVIGLFIRHIVLAVRLAGEYVRGSPRPGGDRELYHSLRADFRSALGGDHHHQRVGGRHVDTPGDLRGLPASLHICIFDSLVHRHGGPSALGGRAAMTE